MAHRWPGSSSSSAASRPGRPGGTTPGPADGARTVRLVVAYDGTAFHGWARQRGAAIRTVEGVLTEALERVLGERPPLSAAGRTDAGVHARGQVISFATRSTIDPGRIQAALNGRLAPEVVVTRAGLAPPGFDARFSATAREYRYTIRTSELPDPYLARYEWHRPGDPSVGRMRAAARDLIGTHDFASFCRRPGGGRSTVRTLHRLGVRRHGDLVLVDARADAFLHQMVRSLVGTLVAVGAGLIDPAAMPSILEARDRAAAGVVAPPHGLVLERVIYGRRVRPRRGEL